MKSTLLSLLLITSYFGFSQTYSKVYLDQLDVEGQAICHNASNGIVIAGINGGDAMVFRVDSVGEVIWEKRWATTGSSFPSFQFCEVLPTSDSAFVICGTAFNETISKMSALVMKIDVDGNLLWQRIFDNGNSEQCDHSAIIETADSNYLLSWGAYYEGNSFSTAKMDENGTVLWARSYAQTFPTLITDIEVLNDSTYVIAGSIYNPNTFDYTGILVAIDDLGDPQWDKAYDALYVDDIVLQNNTIYIAGKDFGNSDFVYCMADLNGTIVDGFTPNGTYGMNLLDIYSQLVATPDSSVVYFCTDYFSSSTAFKIRPNGTISESVQVMNKGRDLMLDNDSGIILLGNGPTYGVKTIWNSHANLLKTDSLLNVSDCGWDAQVASLQIPLPNLTTRTYTAGSTPINSIPVFTDVASNLIDSAICAEFIGGLSEMETDLDVRVYPNISTGIFNFDWNSDAVTDVRIYSLLGELVWSESNAFQNTSVDLSTQATGIYHYRIVDANGIAASGSIVLAP